MKKSILPLMAGRSHMTAAICCVVLFIALSGCGDRSKTVEAAMLDITQWKTHATGRFLIDLPPNARCKFTAQIWKEPLTWRKGLTVDTARGEALKLAGEYKNTPHDKFSGKSMLIDVLDLSGGGVAVHRWGHSYSTGMTTFEVYFVSQDERKRVFYYSIDASVDRLDLAKRMITAMAKTMHAHDDSDPLSTEPGFAFEGGFLRHTGEWRAERSIVAFTLPDYPGIKGYFACYGFGKKQQFMFDRGDNERIAEGFSSRATVLRKGECLLNGIPAQEIGLAGPGKGRREYLFDMEAPGQGKDIGRPMLVLHLWSDEENSGKGFLTDEEAVAVWNAIRDSIRLRPGAI